MEELAQ